MTDTITFDPATATRDDIVTVARLRPIAQSIPAEFAAWCERTGRDAWGTWILSDSPTWGGFSLDSMFRIAADEFLVWARDNAHLFNSTSPALSPAPLFTPGMTVEAMRAAGLSLVLASVRDQWLQWCRETGQPVSWATALLDPDEYVATQAQRDYWTRDFEAFSAWAAEHHALFTTTIRIPAAVVDRGYHTPLGLAARIRASVLAQGTDPLLPLFRRWQEGAQAAGNPNRLIGPMLAGDPLNDDALRFFMGALHFAHGQQPSLFTITDDVEETTMTTTAVPSGDTTTALTIGPDTPGWDEWWETVAEAAQEDGYEEQYNVLARAFGASEIDETADYDVQIRVESFYVTVTVNSSRSLMQAGEYDINQGDIDEAIADHIRHNDVDYQTEGYEQV